MSRGLGCDCSCMQLFGRVGKGEVCLTKNASSQLHMQQHDKCPAAPQSRHLGCLIRCRCNLTLWPQHDDSKAISKGLGPSKGEGAHQRGQLRALNQTSPCWRSGQCAEHYPRSRQPAFGFEKARQFISSKLERIRRDRNTKRCPKEDSSSSKPTRICTAPFE